MDTSRPKFPLLQHHGAIDGVTGSCHQLHLSADYSLLVDCGLFQGQEASANGRSHAEQLRPDFDISTLGAVLITHVHIDHVGRLPYLLAAGYQGPILCSEPSAHLLELVLEDALRLSLSKRPADIRRYLQRIRQAVRPLAYRRWYTLLDTPRLKLEVRLQRAGHILGSAYIECRIHTPAHDTPWHVVFSGDLGAPHTPMLPAPRPPQRADLLVLESTYGDRRHPDRRLRRHTLRTLIEQALADQGTVLIPAFSIGRTQELLYELEDIIHHNPDSHWHELPIILDSPLASRFTQAYRRLHQHWDAEAHQRLKRGRNPLDFAQLLSVDSHEAHQRMVRHLAATARPAVVIAASGMCSGGRIVNYLKAMLGDARHNVLFLGYQARGTLGHHLQQLSGPGQLIDIDARTYTVNAGLHSLSGYSGHADQRNLIGFVRGMCHWPQEIRLVHGSPHAKQVLGHALAALYAERGLPLLLQIPGTGVPCP